MPDRLVKTTLIIDAHGSVKAVRSVGDESARTEGKLSKLDKSVKGLGDSFGGLKSLALGGLGALGVGGLGLGLSNIVSKTKELALETEKFHTQTGISVQSSLYYDKALKARGLTSEEVGKAFGILAKNVKSAELQDKSWSLGVEKGNVAHTKRLLALKKAEATGKTYAITQARLGLASEAVGKPLSKQAAAFQELGINLAQFNKLSEQGKLEEVTKRFEALAPGMQKSRLERELFGRQGNELSIVLEKGNLGLTHQIDLVKKYFPTVKDGANAMNELLEKQTESKLAMEGLEFTIGQKLIPVLTTVMGHMSKVALEVEKGKGVWGELEHTFEGIVGVLKGLWNGFEDLVGPGKAATLALEGVVGLMVVAKVQGFVSAIAGIAPALAAVAPELIPIGLAIAGIYEGYKHIQEINEFLHPTVHVWKGKQGYEKLAGQKQASPGFTMAENMRLIAAGTRAGAGPMQREEAVKAEQRAAASYLQHPGTLTRASVSHMAPQELQAIAEAFARAHRAEPVPIALRISGDSALAQAIAQAVIMDPRARRIVAESTTMHGLNMNARK